MAFSFVQNGGLLTVLSTDKNVYLTGEPVRISLFKLNISPRSIMLTYPTTQRFDFSVTGPGGEVWRWSHDKVFAQFVEFTTLLPGQSVSYTEIWPQVNFQGARVPPGIYRVTGWNTFEGFALFPVPSVFIRISP